MAALTTPSPTRASTPIPMSQLTIELFAAAAKKNAPADVFEGLVGRGADIHAENSEGKTPYQVATESGNKLGAEVLQKAAKKFYGVGRKRRRTKKRHTKRKHTRRRR